MTTQSPPSQGRTDPSTAGPAAGDGGSGRTRRIRWPRWGWAPYVLVAGFVGFWAATHTGAVISGLGSWRAVAFGIAAGILTLVLLVGVARLTRRGWAGQLAGLVPLIAAVTVAVLPSYLPSTVNEAAPEGLADAESAPSAAPEPPAGSAPGPTPAAGQPAPSAETTVPAPSGPVELGAAQFVGIDHEAAGTARLIQLEDGSLVVRFEQFSVEPGPDYDVYVIPGANMTQPGGTLLGGLKGTSGDQNYEVPAGALQAVDQPVTVLIWCTVFTVPIANATF